MSKTGTRWLSADQEEKLEAWQKQLQPEETLRFHETKKGRKIRMLPLLHYRKVRFFISNFKHPLESNEWKVKWPIKHSGGSTYNPDFWCEKMKCFIELATSKPNIYQSWKKWTKAVRIGYPLKIYWWEGEDITAKLLNRPRIRVGSVKQYLSTWGRRGGNSRSDKKTKASRANGLRSSPRL